MLNKTVNPFVAIFLLSVISIAGTVFLLHQIHRTDFTYAYLAQPGV